jgi:release factor glutamine methyltransferase
VQHLTGAAHFAGLELQVGPGVFIPRPETELMLELLPVAPQPPRGQRLLDLGAGSGAIGLAFKERYPELAVDLVEKSPMALKYLRRNVNAYNRRLARAGLFSPTAPGARPLAGQSTISPVRVYGYDMLELLSPPPANGPGRRPHPEKPRPGYDYIVANPPYIPTTETISGAAANDPAPALFAGGSGLDLIAQIIAKAPNLLQPQGVLLLEHHSSQRSAIAKLFNAGGWSNVQFFDDLNGLPRFAQAIRPKASSAINEPR